MMSNPAVQNVTAAVSQRMRGSSDPRTAIHAAAGAIPRAKPSTMGEREGKRLGNEISNTTASASGARRKQSEFSSHAANSKSALAATVNPQQNVRESRPAGMWGTLGGGLGPS